MKNIRKLALTALFALTAMVAQPADALWAKPFTILQNRLDKIFSAAALWATCFQWKLSGGKITAPMLLQTPETFKTNKITPVTPIAHKIVKTKNAYAYGNSPLHDAAEKGDLKTIRDLIKNGANLNAKNNNGDTAVHVAALHNKPEIIRCLVNNGALVNAKNFRGQTPMAWATETSWLAKHNQAIPLLEELEKLSPNVNQFIQKNKE